MAGSNFTKRMMKFGSLLAVMLVFCVPLASHAQVNKVDVVKSTDGWRLQVDGDDFYMKGVVWGYTPRGQNYTYNLFGQSDDQIRKILDYEFGLMSAMGVNAIRSFTMIPPQWVEYIYREHGIMSVINPLMGRYGYREIRTPVFEETDLFARSIGSETDIVTKEMYDFVDKGDRHVALRPEMTASVCRAFAEHRPTLPWKIYYSGSNFRYEKPQRGRYRQFDQVGVEVLIAAVPQLSDVAEVTGEQIALALAAADEVTTRRAQATRAVELAVVHDQYDRVCASRRVGMCWRHPVAHRAVTEIPGIRQRVAFGVG